MPPFFIYEGSLDVNGYNKQRISKNTICEVQIRNNIHVFRSKHSRDEYVGVCINAFGDY